MNMMVDKKHFEVEDPPAAQSVSNGARGSESGAEENPAAGPERGDPRALQPADRTQRALRVIIAGGGTGGHLFPGIAIACEFMVRNSQSNILFVSTGNPFEKSALSKANFALETITVEGIKGRGLWNQAKSVSKLPKGIFQSSRIVGKFKPDITLGLGSYSAGPVILAARLRGVRVVLHEQNFLPGITNRILARFADRIYVSFEATGARFDPQKVYLTGNPVRSDILEIFDPQNTRKADENAARRPFTVLIIGGSQGAHSINMAMTAALEHLANKDEIYFVHQTGSTDEKVVDDAYRRHGIKSTVKSFFDHMAQLYRDADLVICRAGATTVAEITAIGKAAIFIPFPFAADNHQVLNADTLSNVGAADRILEKELSGKTLGAKIEFYAANRRALADMALKAKTLGNPDAARDIVDDVYRLMET